MRGFTIVELLLILFLVGITVVVLSPKFNSPNRAQLDAAARALAVDLTYIRERAIETGVAHTCAGIHTPKDGYHLYQGTSTTTEIKNPWTQSSPFTIYFQDSGYTSVTWQSSPNFTISFDANGTPTVTGIALSNNQYTLTLANGSATQSVNIVNVTGLVQ